MNYFLWSHFSRDGEAFHIARARLKGKYATMMHSQNFPEVFWIEQGNGMHTVNGHALPISKGDLVFVRDTDVHSFSSPPDTDGFVLVNIAFPSSTLTFIHKRYFSSEKRWFWQSCTKPETLHLDNQRLSWLRKWVDRLESDERSRLNIEIFLLELLREVKQAAPPETISVGPDWLREALKKASDSHALYQGTAALARIAGCTPQHLNATIKKHHGRTATEVLNIARMEFAARELRTSTKKIIEICFDCGFQNLSHFYSLFKTHSGMTPKHYRRAHQALIR